MEFPLRVIINSLNAFCICHFKDKIHAPSAPAHFYVVVPTTDDSSLLLCIMTSQVEKRKSYYLSTGKDKAIGSLVRLNQNDFPFLTKETIIDCNQPILVKKSELIHRIDPKYGFTIKVPEISESLKKQIVSAIHNSPIVRPFIKKLIPEL